MKTNKNMILLAFTSIFLIYGCKRMTTENLTEHPDTKKARFIPVKLEAKTEIIELKYKENTTSLLEIKDGATGKKEVLIYNKENQLSGFERYENNQMVYSSDYFRDQEKRITTVNQFKINGPVSTPTGYFKLSYNSRNQIISIKSYSTTNVLLNSKTLAYDEHSNLINTIKDYPLPMEKSSFSYDTENAIFKYVPGVELISMESRYRFFGAIVNNILVSSGEINYSFTYSYNSDHYPDQVILNEANVKTNFNVTYKKLTE